MKMTRTANAIYVIFKAIPLRVRKTAFSLLFLLIYYLSSKHRMIALQNLSLSFPGKSITELKKIAKGACRNFGVVAAEFFEIPSLKQASPPGWITVEGIENYRKAHAKKKGILMYSAHFGNWEMGSACFPLYTHWLHAIHRPLDNKILESLVEFIRTATGNQLLPKGGFVKKIIRSLRNNEIIGILIDQNTAWQEGVFVDFFGRQACTTTGLAALAMQTGASVLPVFMIRNEKGTYRFVIKEEVEISITDDYDTDIVENTQRYTAIIEEVVKEYPDQWFWIHQRWKTKRCQMSEDKRAVFDY